MESATANQANRAMGCTQKFPVTVVDSRSLVPTAYRRLCVNHGASLMTKDIDGRNAHLALPGSDFMDALLLASCDAGSDESGLAPDGHRRDPKRSDEGGVLTAAKPAHLSRPNALAHASSNPVPVPEGSVRFEKTDEVLINSSPIISRPGRANDMLYA